MILFRLEHDVARALSRAGIKDMAARTNSEGAVVVTSRLGSKTTTDIDDVYTALSKQGFDVRYTWDRHSLAVFQEI